MGVGAYVYCRCWQDGLATPAPAGPIGFDEDGRLGLLTRWDVGNAAEHAAVDNWLRHGCPHEAGGSHYPTLLAHLPKTNDGCLPAAAVPSARDELDHFESRAELPDEIVLVDEATGDALHAGVFIRGRYEMGVGPDGFSVVDSHADLLFRAHRFEQRTLPGGELELTGDGRSVRLITTPIAGFLPVPPRLLAVQVRARSAADFAGHLATLRRLCAASLATGNPVNWV